MKTKREQRDWNMNEFASRLGLPVGKLEEAADSMALEEFVDVYGGTSGHSLGKRIAARGFWNNYFYRVQ